MRALPPTGRMGLSGIPRGRRRLRTTARGEISGLAAALIAVALTACGGGGTSQRDGDAAPPADGSVADGAPADGGEAGGGVPDGVVVDTPSGQLATEMADGQCDILEAITAATAGRSLGDCANPTGSSRIILKAGNSYPVGKTLRFVTTGNQTIRLGIADGTNGPATITAATPWLLDPGDPPTGCLVHVSGSTGGVVQLEDVALTQADGLTLTGACVERGTLVPRRTRLTGFRHGAVSATCLPETQCSYDAGDFATVQVDNSLIDGNSTDGDGGGIYSNGFGATVVVYHSSIVGNTAAGAGGGIYFGGGWNTNVIRASTLSGNHANVGGGMMVKFECSNTYVNIYNSTIAYNTAQGTGGGIEFEPAPLTCVQQGMVVNSAKQDVTVNSSIISANHSLSTMESNINAAWFKDDSGASLGIFNCLGGSVIYVAPGLPRPMELDQSCFLDTRDARIGPLMPMGGAGELPVHPLLSGSPAIDAAPTDQMLDDERDGWIPLIDPPLAEPGDDWMLFDRMADGDGDGRVAPDFGAIEMSPRWQTELLTVAAKGPGRHEVIVSPPGFDRGAGTLYDATSATNELVTYRLPIAEPGYYDLTVGVLQTASGGKFQIAVAEDANGPWSDVGAVQDDYAESPAFAALGPLPAPLFATPGEKLIRFTVAGKNTASGGYTLSLDYIDARRSTKACPATELGSGANHSCAVVAGGGLRCWGGNDAGQLGDTTTADAWRAPALDTLAGVSAVAGGARHTCALMIDGSVRCWGANDTGQLGDGSTASRATPPPQSVITGIQAIAAGANHTCALTTSGGVRCWGGNMSGQLGDGTMTDRHAPASTDVLTGVKAIAAGGSTTCALTTTGGVRCWGGNTFGQLGDGTTTDRASPPAADVLTGAAAISVGDGHACAVTSAGGVRCWGHNSLGQLGDGTAVDALAPPAADALASVHQVAAGANFTCALTAAGGVRCWGYNSDGQIGDDTPNATERLTPATTDILAGVQEIGVGTAHVCARMASGAIRCWGANAVGQLGDGLVPDPASTPPAMDIVRFAGTCR